MPYPYLSMELYRAIRHKDRLHPLGFDREWLDDLGQIHASGHGVDHASDKLCACLREQCFRLGEADED
jgi:hypothetical protein